MGRGKMRPEERKRREARKVAESKYPIKGVEGIILASEVPDMYNIRPSTFRRLIKDGIFDVYLFLGLARKVDKDKYSTWIFTKGALDDYFEADDDDSLYEKYKHLLDEE